MYEVAQKRRVLVVEDEVAIQHVLCFFLRHHNFEALGAANGQEAMRVIPEFRPDLIILDLVMQPGSGWDVLHWLREQQLLTSIPVLVVSALVHLSEQMHGFEEGAIEYLTKPTQPSIIVKHVNTLLSMSQEQRARLYHMHLDQRRKTLDRLYATPPDEFVY